MNRVLILGSLSIALLGCAREMMAQTDTLRIEGTVWDGTWERPLPNAQVALVRERGGELSHIGGAITDERGGFRIDVDLSGPYIVQVRAMCYEPVEEGVEVVPGEEVSEGRFVLERRERRIQAAHSACPPTPDEDSLNRPLLETLLSDERVVEWLRPWLAQGIVSLATECLDWGSDLTTGELKLRIRRPDTSYGGMIASKVSELYLDAIYGCQLPGLTDRVEVSVRIRHVGDLGRVPRPRALVVQLERPEGWWEVGYVRQYGTRPDTIR